MLGTREIRPGAHAWSGEGNVSRDTFTVASNFRDLTFVTLDPLHARRVSIAVARQTSVILIPIAMSVVVCISAIGIVLTASLLIGPALSARLVTSTIAQQVLAGTGLTLFQVFTGFVVSYHLISPRPRAHDRRPRHGNVLADLSGRLARAHRPPHHPSGPSLDSFPQKHPRAWRRTAAARHHDCGA